MKTRWFLMIGDNMYETEAENIEFAALNFITKHNLKENVSELTEHILSEDEFKEFNPSLVPKNRLKHK